MDEQLQIKVADFGLARNVYITDYYRQQSNGKIPAKWMAPEALHDRISNEKTDVVSLSINSMYKLYRYRCTCIAYIVYNYVCNYSGHMASRVGRYLVLDVLLIPLYLIMKY